ncbi:MAG: transcription regulator [Sulfuriferula sp.]
MKTRSSDKPDKQGGPDEAPTGIFRWLRDEAIDHLIPWGPKFLSKKAGVQALGIGLAVVVTVAWILAATGQIRPAIVIAWWVGWSVYEVLCRSRCKPWVKEGPWWGNQRRPATLPDLIAYVATKNLLIGAGIFLVLKLLWKAFSNYGGN